MNFIDSNVFVYAHDEQDPRKSRLARELLLDLAPAKQGAISLQVVNEFCNSVLTKAATPLSLPDVREILQLELLPLLKPLTSEDYSLGVLAIYERYSLSYFDAAIVQAANDMGCSQLYSEDLQDGARYGNVKVVNPFK